MQRFEKTHVIAVTILKTTSIHTKIHSLTTTQKYSQHPFNSHLW